MSFRPGWVPALAVLWASLLPPASAQTRSTPPSKASSPTGAAAGAQSAAVSPAGILTTVNPLLGTILPGLATLVRPTPVVPGVSRPGAPQASAVVSAPEVPPVPAPRPVAAFAGSSGLVSPAPHAGSITAGPASDFDTQVVSEDAGYSTQVEFVKRLASRFQAMGFDHPVAGFSYSVVPAKRLIMRIHPESYRVFSPFPGVAAALERGEGDAMPVMDPPSRSRSGAAFNWIYSKIMWTVTVVYDAWRRLKTA